MGLSFGLPLSHPAWLTFTEGANVVVVVATLAAQRSASTWTVSTQRLDKKRLRESNLYKWLSLVLT